MINRTPEQSTTVTIEKKGTGVIHALRRAFPELESSRIFALAKDACARLKGDIRKGDICRPVQLGERIEITNPKKSETPVSVVQSEALVWDGVATGLVKNGDTYTFNGKPITRI